MVCGNSNVCLLEARIFRVSVQTCIFVRTFPNKKTPIFLSGVVWILGFLTFRVAQPLRLDTGETHLPAPDIGVKNSPNFLYEENGKDDRQTILGSLRSCESGKIKCGINAFPTPIGRALHCPAQITQSAQAKPKKKQISSKGIHAHLRGMEKP